MSALTWPAMTESSETSAILHRPRWRYFGIYIPMFIVAGLAIPIVIYLSIMESLGWRVPTLDARGVVGYVATPDQNVYLYDSPSSRAFFAAQGGNAAVRMDAWHGYFKDRKLQVRELQGPTQLKRAEKGVLILPSMVALSAEEKTEIIAFRGRGGSVLVTWASGTRNEKGDSTGWQFLQDLGFKVTGEIRQEPETNHLILNGESPVTHTAPPGKRIFMTATDEPMLRAQGGAVAGRFMNWARIPHPDRLNEGAVLYSENDARSGRTVYYAFAESTWANNPTTIYSLFDDTLSWLHREPTVQRANWPQAKRAAHVIEMDTEEGFPNALNFSSMMRAAGHPASFFVLTSTGKKFPDVLRTLKQNHEIGYHGDIHTGFKDQTEVTQNQRIRAMRAEMNSVIPDISALLGFRAPTEAYDQTTEKLLQRAGVRYHVVDPNRSEYRLPLWALAEGAAHADDLVVLPRTQRDDINLLVGNPSAEDLTQAMNADAALALDQGAFGLLSVHTQNLSLGSPLHRALPGHLQYIKQLQNNLWLTTTGAAANWWRERERVSIKTVFTGKRLELSISVIGNKPVEGASFLVMLPQKNASLQVTSLKIGGLAPDVVSLDPHRSAFVFSSLPPGNYSYQMIFGSNSN